MPPPSNWTDHCTYVAPLSEWVKGMSPLYRPELHSCNECGALVFVGSVADGRYTHWNWHHEAKPTEVFPIRRFLKDDPDAS